MSDRCTAHNWSSILIYTFLFVCLLQIQNAWLPRRKIITFRYDSYVLAVTKVQEFLPDSTKYAGLSEPGSSGLGAKASQFWHPTLSKPGGQIMWWPCPSFPSDFQTFLRLWYVSKYLNNVLKIVKYTAFWCHVSKWTVCMRDCWKRGGGAYSPAHFCQVY